ncbi:hypothetical protein L1887_50836 [Cichorium endivia]|nr:hypothetical protein L1887_50836 [Cichorium endivia]
MCQAGEQVALNDISRPIVVAAAVRLQPHFQRHGQDRCQAHSDAASEVKLERELQWICEAMSAYVLFQIIYSTAAISTTAVRAPERCRLCETEKSVCAIKRERHKESFEAKRQTRGCWSKSSVCHGAVRRLEEGPSKRACFRVGRLGTHFEHRVVDKVECLDRQLFVQHTRDVDLARALADHLDVDIALGKDGEHATRNADHVAHMLAHQTEDSHVAQYTYGAHLLQVRLDLVERARTQAGSHGHRHMHLGRRNQIHHHTVLVERTKDLGKESMADRLAVRVHVEHQHVVLDRHRRRQLPLAHHGPRRIRLGRSAPRGKVRLARRRRHGRTRLVHVSVDELVFGAVVALGDVGKDDGAHAGGVLDVFDADGDGLFDGLLHGEGVDDFRAVVGELCGFLGSDGGDEACGGHLARVGGEDAIDLLPDLELLGLDADGAESGAEVGVAAADLGEERAGDVAKVAGDDGHACACSQAVAKRVAELVVEGLVERELAADVLDSVCGEGGVDDALERHELRLDTGIAQGADGDAAREALTDADDDVLGLGRDLLDDLCGKEKVAQTLAVVDDVGLDLFEQLLVLGDCLACRGDVVGEDAVDGGVEARGDLAVRVGAGVVGGVRRLAVELELFELGVENVAAEGFHTAEWRSSGAGLARKGGTWAMNGCLCAVGVGGERGDRVGEGCRGGMCLVERLAGGLKEEVCGAERLGLTGARRADDGYLVAGQIGGHDLLCDGIEELAHAGAAVLLDDPLGGWIIGWPAEMCGRRHVGDWCWWRRRETETAGKSAKGLILVGGVGQGDIAGQPSQPSSAHFLTRDISVRHLPIGVRRARRCVPMNALTCLGVGAFIRLAPGSRSAFRESSARIDKALPERKLLSWSPPGKGLGLGPLALPREMISSRPEACA